MIGRTNLHLGRGGRAQLSTNRILMPAIEPAIFEPGGGPTNKTSPARLPPTTVHVTPGHAPIAVAGTPGASPSYGRHEGSGGSVTLGGSPQRPSSASGPAPFTSRPSLVSLLPPLSSLGTSLSPLEATSYGSELSKLLSPAAALGGLLGGGSASPTLPAALPGLEDKTLGSQSTAEILKAGELGGLKLNAGGQLTTPAVRSALQGVTAARQQVAQQGLQGPFTPSQRTFVEELAEKTHLSPRALGAQALAEESEGAASSREAARNNDWLNLKIGVTPSWEPTIPAWSNPKSAAALTAQTLNTSPYYSGIRAARGQGPAAQVAAIGASPWGTQGSTMSQTLGEVSQRSNPGAAQALVAAEQRAKQLGLPVGQGAGPAAPTFQYANPLPASAWSPGRSDQGFDAAPLKGGAPILAVSRGRIIATGAPGWPEGGGVTYRILQGPQKGKEVYDFEGLDPVAGLKPGAVVHRGQVIARGREGGSIETGYYQGNPTVGGHPLNNQLVSDPSATYSVSSSDGSPTIGSAQFEKQILGQAVSVPATGLGAPVTSGGVGGATPVAGSAVPAASGGGGGGRAGTRPNLSLVSLASPLASGPTMPTDLLGLAQQAQEEHAASAAQNLLTLLGETPAEPLGTLPTHRPVLG